MSALFAILVTFAAASPELKPCPSSSEQPSGALCGQLTVAEDRAAKGGRQIPLNIVVLPGRSAAAKSDPVFSLAPGPGIAATRLAITYPRLYDILQNDHDVVLVDQRGTGASNPLHCSAPDPAMLVVKLLSEPPDDKTLTECRDRLSKVADLKQYTTAAAADDLEAVRQAFGYAKINLLGIDYGTRLGLEYVRKYPAQVRAIAMSGVYTPAYRIGVSGLLDAQQSLQNVLSRCAADSGCNAAFPKLAAEYKAVIATLDKGPVNVMLPAEGQPPMKATLSRSMFDRALGQVLLWREDLQALPLAIHMAAGGDFMPFTALWLERELARNPAADGLALSVNCANGAASPFFKRACAIWPHAAPAAAPVSVRGATPALLISGALDPLTPPSYAAEVAKGLTNSAQVVFAHASHVPANPCVHGIITSFLKTGTTQGLDTSCAASFPAPKFLTAMPKAQ